MESRTSIIRREPGELEAVREEAGNLVGECVRVTLLRETDDILGLNKGMGIFGPNFLTVENGTTEHIPLRTIESIGPAVPDHSDST